MLHDPAISHQGEVADCSRPQRGLRLFFEALSDSDPSYYGLCSQASASEVRGSESEFRMHAGTKKGAVPRSEMKMTLQLHQHLKRSAAEQQSQNETSTVGWPNHCRRHRRRVLVGFEVVGTAIRRLTAMVGVVDVSIVGLKMARNER
eukprot:scaffold35154_cov40-Cyclotella_meneghiniana.AAC.1